MKLKKIISLVVVVIMATSIGVISSSATVETGVNENQEILTFEEQLERINNNVNLTDDEKAEMIEYLINRKNPVFTPFSTLPTSKTLTVPFKSQIEDNYCGPATVQQTYQSLYRLRYGGTTYPSTPTQATIATAIGTKPSGSDFQPMIDYINNNYNTLMKTYESLWWWNGQSGFDTACREALVEDKPIMLYASISSSISGRSSTGDTTKWLFPTSGHMLNISGYNFVTSGSERYQMTDPYADRFTGYSSGKYFVSNTVTRSGTVALGL